MVLRAHFLILLAAAMFSFVHGSMNNNLIEFIPAISDDRFDKLSSDEEREVDIVQDDPSYLSNLEDGEFQGLIKENSDNPSPTQCAELLSIKTVNVMSFGAKGDGKHDDSAAFEKAWKTACSSTTSALVVVPNGRNYLLKPTTFSGPCKSSITFQMMGALQASTVRSDYKDRYWLLFKDVNHLLVQGGGTINGNGKIWWQNSCKINKKLPCKGAPTALTFYNSNNLAVKNLKIKDAQQIQVSFQKCINVDVSHITVTAPDESPNTDGIHVTNTQNIQIKNCVIGTGDDCISIVSGSKNVQVTDVTCGPGHGISIGSLGKYKSEAHVSGVVVNRAKLTGTTNGVRIKTWQGGSGSATNIQFQNIVMNNVKNPILIDQQYCDQKTPCTAQKSAVQVKNVVYKNIKGTSSSDVAIKFDCSKTYPCQGIVLQNIGLTLKSQTKKAEASCSNVKLAYIGGVYPKCY